MKKASLYFWMFLVSLGLVTFDGFVSQEILGGYLNALNLNWISVAVADGPPIYPIIEPQSFNAGTPGMNIVVPSSTVVTVEYRDSLMAGEWNVLTSFWADASITNNVRDLNFQDDGVRYYRFQYSQ